MENIYSNGHYREHNPNWHQEDSDFKFNYIKKILQDNKVHFDSVAEVGCGAGGIIKKIAEYFPGAICSGFDTSKDVVSMWPKEITKNLEFYSEDITSSNVFFDLLIVADVFEHVEDYIGFIKKLSEKTKYMVFHIPLDMSVQKILRPQSILENRYHAGHLHYFCKETALATLRDCGLDVIDYRFTKWGLEIKQKSLLKRIGKIPLFILDLFSTDLAARILGGNSLVVLVKKKHV